MIGHIEKLDSESWVNLPWKQFRRDLFRLQKRTYKAVREYDTAKARSLQKLIMRSVAARFLAIRQVTQLNNGKKTAGIDGKLALDFKERFELEQKLKTQAFQLEASRATFYSNPQEGRLKADTKSTHYQR